MKCVLGIDLGTSYYKAGLFDPDGTALGMGRVAVETVSDPTGVRRELAPERFWELLRQAVQTALASEGINPGDVEAVSYASQANTFLLLDERGTPLTPLVVWNDRRAAEDDPELAAWWAQPDVAGVTGCGFSGPEFALAKMRWFARHEPRIWAEKSRILTLAGYLTWGLTGRAYADRSTVGLLAMWDIARTCWWGDALKFAGVLPEELCEPLPVGSRVGTLTATGAARLGLKAGTPFAVGTLDHHAAALGAGIGNRADLSVSLGTVIAALAVRDEYQSGPELFTARHVIPEKWFALAFTEHGAALLERYQRESATDQNFDSLMDAAAHLASCQTEMRIEHDARRAARLVFTDPGQSVSHPHRARAIMEHLNRELARLIQRLQPDVSSRPIIATGGGARNCAWMRLLSRELRRPVLHSDSDEPATRGAAILAAIAAGWYADPVDAGMSMTRLERV